MRMLYAELLGLVSGDVVALVGSGGKTSLLFRLAAENRGRRALVSTTTKMLRPAPREIEGIRLLHGGEVDEKIIAPPMDQLAAACADSALTLLECDGAKGLALKGWAAHEPVVPEFATVTIGVLPLWALGRPVGAETVHRVEQFCTLTGAKRGESVTSLHLAAVIGHAAGLFQSAQGRRVLFLNGRRGEPNTARAEDILAALPPVVLRGLWGVFVGDVHSGTIRRIAV